MKSFESLFDIYAVYIQHPVISKWLTIALCVSLFLNTYLFNAAKQEPKIIIQKVIERVEVPVPTPPASASAQTAPSAATSTTTATSTSAPAAPITSRRRASTVSRPSKRLTHHHSDIIRPLDEVMTLIGTPELLSDEEIIMVVQSGKMAAYALEKVLGDFERAVHIRRALISRDSRTRTLEGSLLPVKNYHYDKVMGACCENVIGYMPIPVGVAGKVCVCVSNMSKTVKNS
jgi:hydroxymethylglutaryl-CoA reductase (NADPH)